MSIRDSRDSIASTSTTTSRFSSLLTPSGPGGTSSTHHHQPTSRPASISSYPISTSITSNPTHSNHHLSSSTSTTSGISNGGGGVNGVGGASGGGGGFAAQKRTMVIYDRNLNKSRGTEVSLGAWMFLFGEIVQYTQKRVSGISEFEKRLSILGYRVGTRLLELLPLRDSLYPVTSTLSRSPPPPTRTLRLLPILTYVHSTLYRYLFNRPADSLERSTENEDEYMIGDDDMVVTRGIQVPKEMKELSCAALVAGIVEAVMDGTGFPARVTAHSVPTAQYPRRTVLLIKLDPQVLQREQALTAPAK
ncbi:TRAPP subunit TRS31 [Sporobolomyces koalae]|uniref:TRAPP subunit TRS31 n=1 Tax=Sporobolomyces koalae TaxID=500713 RepID=UPI003174BE00